ncbi:MAG: hypothetical protein IJW18_06110 [Lachnospiraceae bacterium]|nr:hypothetical protein [Lachnospiraceae bacterium]
MLRIEILYPEVCNLYGDMGNVQYLKFCYPDATFIETALTDRPAFADSDVDMIYMGSMTERIQEKVVDRLKEYKEQLQACIDKGTVILFTGNAYELMGQYIEDEGRRIDCLGFFPYYAKREMMKRHFSVILAEFEGMDVVGFKDQFTMAYDHDDAKAFMKIIKGEGHHEGAMFEGVRYNNFFGTYLLGPFLIMNPRFMKYLMGLLGTEECKLAYEDAVMAAYEKRCHEFRTKSVIK